MKFKQDLNRKSYNNFLIENLSNLHMMRTRRPKLFCKNCGAEVTIENLTQFNCSICNSIYWGYNHLLKLPFSKEFLYEMLKAKNNIDLFEMNWMQINGFKDRKRLLSKLDLDTQSLLNKDHYKLSNVEKRIISTIGLSHLGWLIIKTEEKEYLDYSLHIGKNYIGRPSANHLPNIAIVDDCYVSRYHAVLTIIEHASEKHLFVLTDNKENDPSEHWQQIQSLNGCYLNGDHNRLEVDEEWILSEGDTIQIGQTKLVLKKAIDSKNFKVAQRQVRQQPFEKTVLISKHKKSLFSKY